MRRPSAERLHRAASCARAYRFGYLDLPKPPRDRREWAHLSLSNSVHNAFADWFTLDPADRTPDTAVALLRKRWIPGGYRDDEQAGEYLAAAAEWVAAFTPAWQDAHVLGVERRVNAYLTPAEFPALHEPITLQGRIDLIADRGDGPVIVDWKMYRHPGDMDERAATSTALALYVLAAGRTLRKRISRAELHEVRTGSVGVVDYDRGRLMRHIDRIIVDDNHLAGLEQTMTDSLVGVTDPETVQAIRDDVFPAAPSGLCASCWFRDSCPDGQLIPAATTWQYLPDLDPAH